MAIQTIDVLVAIDDYYVLGYDMTASDLAHQLKCSDTTARRWAKKLVAEGLVSTMPVQIESKMKLACATAYDLSKRGREMVEAHKDAEGGKGTEPTSAIKCICPLIPCEFCRLPMKERLKLRNLCTREDVDQRGLYCGHPLPCPRHPAGEKDG